MTTPRKESIAVVNAASCSLRVAHLSRLSKAGLGETDPNPKPAQHSSKIRRLKFLPGTVPDVQHFNHFLLLQNAVDHTIDVMLATVEQVSDSLYSRALPDTDWGALPS